MKNIFALGVIIASLIFSPLPVSAELPICRASTCSGAEENGPKYRKEHGISRSELPCENTLRHAAPPAFFPAINIPSFRAVAECLAANKQDREF
jgi:hypothetical protein